MKLIITIGILILAGIGLAIVYGKYRCDLDGQFYWRPSPTRSPSPKL